MIISWNVCDLGSLFKRKFIKEAIRDYGISFCLLVETKVTNCSSALINFLWPRHCIRWVLINDMSKSGGMLLMWDESIFLAKSIKFSKSWIYIMNRHIKNDVVFVVMGIYAPCSDSGRRIVWNELSELHFAFMEYHWFLCGDCNETQNALDKNNGFYNRKRCF
jgi:hypothetical protein